VTRQCACGRPTDLYGCQTCSDYLAKQLGDVPALVVELTTTLTRQGRTTSGGGRSSETPLVFYPPASETQRKLQDKLVTWALHIATHYGPALSLEPPAKTEQRWAGRSVTPVPPAVDKATLAARWLLRNVKSIRRAERYREIHYDITRAVGDARWVIDRRADRIYVGVCDGAHSVRVDDPEPCGTGLFADREWVTVQCGVCGIEYDIELRRQRMLDEVRLQEGSSVWVSRTLAALGMRVPDGTIRKWVERGKLQPRNWAFPEGRAPRPLYRVDDVIAVAAGQAVDYEEAS
jgi:hypothetical protein